MKGLCKRLLLDPPTKVALFRLPDKDGDTTLTFEYLSPSQRNQIVLHPVLIGNPEAILKHLLSAMGFSLVFAGILMVLGVFLRIMSFSVTRFEKTGIALFWLGLFSICTGIWVMGECNLTGLLVENANILYIMTFCGLFTVAIPLTKFCHLMAYLDQVSAEIPEGFLGNLCENEAVNALALYYQTVAREAGISVVIQLNIPADTGQVPANDLCVIIGNIVEKCFILRSTFRFLYKGAVKDGLSLSKSIDKETLKYYNNT